MVWDNWVGALALWVDQQSSLCIQESPMRGAIGQVFQEVRDGRVGSCFILNQGQGNRDHCWWFDWTRCQGGLCRTGLLDKGTELTGFGSWAGQGRICIINYFQQGCIGMCIKHDINYTRSLRGSKQML